MDSNVPLRLSAGHASTGRASTGRASTGRASTGRASTGHASTGRHARRYLGERQHRGPQVVRPPGHAQRGRRHAPGSHEHGARTGTERLRRGRAQADAAPGGGKADPERRHDQHQRQQELLECVRQPDQDQAQFAQCPPVAALSPTASRPATERAALRAAATPRSRPARTSRAESRNAEPAAVSTAPRLVRDSSAAFSLKQREDEGLTKEEAEAANRWRKHISHIAAQEMLHLSLVQNLLSAIGAAPHLSRPNFPQPASHYPAGVTLALIPFGEDALRHFMFLERPEGMDITDVAGMAAFSRAQPSMQHGDIVPRGQDFATVGHLYRSIEQGFKDLAEKYGEEQLFAGPPQAQATQADFGWPELVAVTGVASAQRAIDEILEQGEGPRGDWKDAHFGQFVEILDEYTELREANPDFDPVRPVVPVNVRPTERDVDVPLASDPLARRVMDMFNVSYEILLLMLQRFFARTEETPAQLKVLSDGAIALMRQAIRPLGDLVTTLPAGP